MSAGITLNPSKKTMVESRLIRRLRELDLSSYKEYLSYLKTNMEEKEKFINSLTTNLTDFFRERAHYDYLKKNIYPEIKHNNQDKKIRVWSAASSTGEEVYSIAFCLHEYFGEMLDWDYKVLGTDIDTNVLETARNGVYNKSLLKTVSPDMVMKYFQKGSGGNLDKVRIKTIIKNNVKLRQFNLLTDSFDSDIQFDFIFLRNVLIYFDNDVIEIAANTMHKYLKPGGYLFIGHSETLNNVKHDFKTISSSIYYKK